ncbi:unnamed protein product [Merluccius merluccius]
MLADPEAEGCLVCECVVVVVGRVDERETWGGEERRGATWGSDTSGMEDDRPKTSGRNAMPRLLGGGGGEASGTPRTETSPADGKVGDLSRHVLILSGDAAAASAAALVARNGESEPEIQRRAARREEEGEAADGDGDARDGRHGGTTDPHEPVLYYDPGPEEETPVLREVEEVESDSDDCYYNFDSMGHAAAAAAAAADRRSYLDAEQHVYCTVYCIANDTDYRSGFGELAAAADRCHDDATPSGAGEMQTQIEAAARSVVGSYPELCNLGDLVLAARRVSASCLVCLLDGASIVPLQCCGKAVCDECLKRYISSQVQIGKAYIACPIPECSGILGEGLVVSHLANEELARYHYFLELCQLDASTKPCPQCNLFTSLETNAPNRTEHKYKIECSACQFIWCFKCHAPWHSGLKCRDYRRGDKLLRKWASVIEHGQRNAQKCPRCKIHIQRTEGCDHMTCTQCNTNFCYRCGERYRQMRFFGDHTSNLSVFGCKYRYLPDKPHLRRLIRGSVCASKVVFAPVVLVLVVVLGALSLVIGLVVFPVYYVCKRKKKQQLAQGSDKGGVTF